MNLKDTIRHIVMEPDEAPILTSAPSTTPTITTTSILPSESYKSVALGGPDATLRAKVYPAAGPLPTFVATLESLKTYIPDESARTKAALGALIAQGIQASDIGRQIQECTAAIQAETEKFNNQKNLHLSSQVVSRKTQIEEKNRQISDLTAERDKLASELVIEEQKSDARTEAFNASTKSLAVELSAIQNKLGGLA